MVDPNKTTKLLYLAQCLYDCIEDIDLRNLKVLLEENGADPTFIIPEEGGSPFFLLITGDYEHEFILEATKLFLKHGANPNCSCCESGLAPIHIVSALGRNEILLILLKYNGNLLIKDKLGYSPIDYAKMNKHEKTVCILEKLIENGWHNKSYINEVFNEVLETDRLVINSNCDIRIKLSDESESYKTCDSNSMCFSSGTVQIMDKKDFIANSTKDKNDTICKLKEINNTDNLLSKDNDNNIEATSNVKSLGNNTNTISLSCKKNNSILLDNSFISGMICTGDHSYYCFNRDKNKSENKPSATKDSIETLIVDEYSHVNHNSIQLPKQKTILACSEDYKVTDDEEGVEFIERRYLAKPLILSIQESGVLPLLSEHSQRMSFSLDIDYDTDTLRTNLTNLGISPGPITPTTKKVYLKKLIQLWNSQEIPKNVCYKQSKVYTAELEKTLKNANWLKSIDIYSNLEHEIQNYFNNTKLTMRGGRNKTSFNYLLLDSRITLNLPLRAKNMSETDVWKTFVNSVFYVGKGKRNRPYSHLYAALKEWNQNKVNGKSSSKKIQFILDMWKEQHGVVCLHVFQNTVPVEAHTREAAMIDAIGLKNLKNVKAGEYYGVSLNWKRQEKCKFGSYLLYKSLLIFLNEGERQLRPSDID